MISIIFIIFAIIILMIRYETLINDLQEQLFNTCSYLSNQISEIEHKHLQYIIGLENKITRMTRKD